VVDDQDLEELEGDALDWLVAPRMAGPHTPAELVRSAVEQLLHGAVDDPARLAYGR